MEVTRLRRAKKKRKGIYHLVVQHHRLNYLTFPTNKYSRHLNRAGESSEQTYWQRFDKRTSTKYPGHLLLSNFRKTARYRHLSLERRSVERANFDSRAECSFRCRTVDPLEPLVAVASRAGYYSSRGRYPARTCIVLIRPFRGLPTGRSSFGPGKATEVGGKISFTALDEERPRKAGYWKYDTFIGQLGKWIHPLEKLPRFRRNHVEEIHKVERCSWRIEPGRALKRVNEISCREVNRARDILRKFSRREPLDTRCRRLSSLTNFPFLPWLSESSTRASDVERTSSILTKLTTRSSTIENAIQTPINCK